MRTRGRPAGGSARRKYNDMLRGWRRRKRGLFLALAAGFLITAVAANLAAARYHRWSWGAGVLTGCLMTAFVAIRLEPPAYIQQWELGAWGEEWTAKQLRKLPGTWRVLHDLPAGRGNYDHVVIGPPGVFLLDSKNWHGEVTVTESVATLRRLEDPDLSCVFDRLPQRMRHLAMDLQQQYKGLELRPGWVTPVVVVWAKFPQQRVGDDKLAYVHGDQVASWLAAQPARLQPGQVQALHAALLPTKPPRRLLGRLKPHPTS